MGLIGIKAVMGKKEGGSMGEYRKFGGVWMVGEWGNFWLLEKLGQVWGKYGRSGEMCRGSEGR